MKSQKQKAILNKEEILEKLSSQKQFWLDMTSSL